MYLFLVFCSMYAYFVVAVETDSSYKPSFKKKDRPGTEKKGTNLTAIQRNSGASVAVQCRFFSSSDSIRASTQRHNAIFFILA